MLQRVFFTLKNAVRYRAALKTLPFEKSMLTIDWQQLYNSGARVVVLDFDGVLAADHREELYPGVSEILENILTIFGQHVYIFSNQPTITRQNYFTKKFPAIRFLIAEKKPYPNGLHEIIRSEQVNAQEVVLIDDRILTGGLATVLAGTRCIVIAEPFVSFFDNFWRELYFAGLRRIERLMFSVT